MVECTSIKGGKITLPKEKLAFRPSVYAVIVKDDKVLMLSTRSSGKLFFPGGGINIGEKMEDALKREIKEETGLEIEVGKFLHFKEKFFYYDPKDEAYHMFNFFYLCKPLTFNLLRDEDVDDDEAEKPRWIEIEKIKHMDNNLSAVNEIFQLL